MPLSFVGFAWLFGVLGPLGMNGWVSGAMHGGVHFRGSPVYYCKQGRTLMLSVCLCSPTVCCSVDRAVCLCAVCCGV